MSLTALKFFLLNDLKSYWPYLWYEDKAKKSSVKDFQKVLEHITYYKKIPSFAIFFAKMNFGLLTLTPKKWLLILFDNFEDMLRGAGGFGCMRVAFEFRFFNNLCFVLSLESQITNFSGEMQNTDLLVQSTFSLK